MQIKGRRNVPSYANNVQCVQFSREKRYLKEGIEAESTVVGLRQSACCRKIIGTKNLGFSLRNLVLVNYVLLHCECFHKLFFVLFCFVPEESLIRTI